MNFDGYQFNVSIVQETDELDVEILHEDNILATVRGTPETIWYLVQDAIQEKTWHVPTKGNDTISSATKTVLTDTVSKKNTAEK